MLHHDPVLAALLLCAVPDMVTFDGMRPFLFWANAERSGASDTAWTVLLTARRGLDRAACTTRHGAGSYRMGFGSYRAALSLFSTLPVVAWLAVHLRAGRIIAQPRG